MTMPVWQHWQPSQWPDLWSGQTPHELSVAETAGYGSMCSGDLKYLQDTSTFGGEGRMWRGPRLVPTSKSPRLAPDLEAWLHLKFLGFSTSHDGPGDGGARYCARRKRDRACRCHTFSMRVIIEAPLTVGEFRKSGEGPRKGNVRGKSGGGYFRGVEASPDISH